MAKAKVRARASCRASQTSTVRHLFQHGFIFAGGASAAKSTSKVLLVLNSVHGVYRPLNSHSFTVSLTVSG